MTEPNQKPPQPDLSLGMPKPSPQLSKEASREALVDSKNQFDDFINPNPMPASDLSYQPHLPAHTHQTPRLSKAEETSLIRHNHLTYLMYVLSFFTAGLLWIVPIVMNYARRREADGTWLATHFDWQIKTCWSSLGFGLIGVVMVIIGLGGVGISALAESTGGAIGSVGLGLFGGLILFLATIWHIYRIVRGWVALTDKRPVP